MDVRLLWLLPIASQLFVITVHAQEVNGPCDRPCGQGTCVEDNVCDCPEGFIGTDCKIYRTQYWSVTLTAIVDVPQNTFDSNQQAFSDALADNLKINRARVRILNAYAVDTTNPACSEICTEVQMELLAEGFSSASMPEKYTAYGAAAKLFFHFDQQDIFTKPKCCGGGIDGSQYTEFRIVLLKSEELPISPGGITGIVVGVILLLLFCGCCYKQKDKVANGAGKIKTRFQKGPPARPAPGAPPLGMPPRPMGGPPGMPPPRPMGGPPGMPPPMPYAQPYNNMGSA